uniref:Methyltransf_21 domain-containing protein n=1 Tax=Caenorhabditis tropicalis TaxID=1561998 RepID=A0A1I7UNF7_9PELO
MTRSSTLLLFAAFSAAVLYFYHNQIPILRSLPFISTSTATHLYNKWSDCMNKDMSLLMSSDDDTFWNQLENPIQKCEQLKDLKMILMEPFTNFDETKYSILPICGNTVMSVVTLGIGQDTAAESELRKRIGNYSVQFYGADPIVEGNDELFSQIGTFFPFAVGNSSRMGTASVLLNGTYVDRRVVYVEFVEFLKGIIGKTFFDNIWIDGEYAEYELFDYFYVGGRLDQEGITVCQFNMEMHLPTANQKYQFKKFMIRIYQEQRYAFFRPVRGSHIRLYFVNFKDPSCTKKFISE